MLIHIPPPPEKTIKGKTGSALSKKKRINSKAKGGAWEREVAKELSAWYSGNKRDDLFYRSASSGGRFTQRKKQGKHTTNSAGDLSYLDSVGEPFLRCCVVEIKSGYKNATVLNLFSAKKPELVDFFTQAHEESQSAGVPYWIVIHKADRRPPMLYCPVGFLQTYLSHKITKPPKWYTLPVFELPFQVIVMNMVIDNAPMLVAGIKFDDFLTLDPKIFTPERFE